MAGNGVLVVIETSGGQPRPAALELCGAAQAVQEALGSATALVVGQGIGAATEQAARLGVARVLAVDAPEFAEPVAERVARAVLVAWEQLDPALVLLPGTTLGRDVAALVAARRGVPHLVDVVALGVTADELMVTRPVYQSKLLTTVRASRTRAAVVTVRAGSFRPPEPGEPVPIERLPVELQEPDRRVRVTRMVDKPRGQVDLESAPVVVVGGRGVGGPEGFEQLAELAELLGGALGCTRAVSDLGWRPHYEQIGQTGKQVRPKLYLGVGVSGAVQHTVGMQGSETVVVINRDSNAPLVKQADFAVIADWNEIVPRLIARLRERRGRSA
ncbi:electron transfer flavoprotein subunit alpha/FixB family protein [Thermomicrobium sp. 4228-Ro]|uniref:electron transfer flavoprotein subunit alpha/FixB family protein n=1 Tax=Thermomicrobium sp. 4228-Ro TaxID=2993937 RepID=UPI0022499E37|nr:electron transfer flavoprotein subunit alpha/FixB family protein [Thermomicrobium sp. 4228-Ro]MCX2727042.1 electron transfer flavoprotein subunit alpha/FixB family protein [Thermomicrobium sp. 4228-Ro]